MRRIWGWGENCNHGTGMREKGEKDAFKGGETRRSTSKKMKGTIDGVGDERHEWDKEGILRHK